MTTRAQTGSLKPKAFNHTKHPPLPDPTPSELIEPTTFAQAHKITHWQQAMTNEFLALCRNKTWLLVPRPSNTNLVGCKWVYRIKKNADGTLQRYKARLVAKGFHQEEGVDYFDTFSPVVQPPTIRLVLSIALAYNWPLCQPDINNGDLHETIFMEQPRGFIDPAAPTHVCKLQKAPYGLKQTPRAWFNKLKQFFRGKPIPCLSIRYIVVCASSTQGYHLRSCLRG